MLYIELIGISELFFMQRVYCVGTVQEYVSRRRVTVEEGVASGPSASTTTTIHLQHPRRLTGVKHCIQTQIGRSQKLCTTL